MIWVLQVFEWSGKYHAAYPCLKKDWITIKDHFLNYRKNAKYIILDINTKDDGKIYDAMLQLSQNELQLLYSCKNALTPEQVVLYFKDNEIAV